MPIYLGLNDTIEGEIYCVFERSTKPTAVSTTGRHRAQAITINGNSATAIIVKTLRYIRERHSRRDVLCDSTLHLISLHLISYSL